MVTLTFLALSFLCSSTLALPSSPLVVPPINPTNILCQLPLVMGIICPPAGQVASNRQTVLGTAQGTIDSSGAYRFPVKYASASRWAPSTLVTAWNLPNGSTNVTALPLACPQPSVDPSAYSEDCLSMIIYVPPTLTLTSSAPTLVWIHGGSFVVGSATGPGMDGSNLAIATNSIVAVVQYRLGALGFMAPNGATNLAAKDLVVALQFLEKVVPAFGGSSSKITLAGQSSGASMIRALLAVPSASSLFTSAILQSDPMDFGFLSSNTQNTLQTYYNSLIGCGASDTACQNNLSLNSILNAQTTLFSDAVDLDPATGQNEPIRPVQDGSFITTPLDSTAPFPSVSKPLLITTVKDEAAFAIYEAFQNPLPPDALNPICQLTFGPVRTPIILSSPYYAPDSYDIRIQLQTMGTDYLWRCSAWTFARNWIQNGGIAYVGQFNLGATYPGNEAVPICTQPGVVCHQDDIEIVFGTVPNPTAAQAALTTEMQQRYKSFLANGSPNAAGVALWSPASSPDVHPLILGGVGKVPVGACDPSFWGGIAEYDYQFYDE